MKTWVNIFLVAVLLSFIACDGEETPSPACILESIEFSPTNRLELTTINGGQLYQLKQFVFAEEKDNLLASYQYIYMKDSVIIKDQKNLSGLQFPYITVKMDGDRPIQVVRFSSATGIRVIYDMDYSDPEKISIEVTREDNIGDRLLFAYGTYTLDANGNTSRFQFYFINTETLDAFNLVEDVFFSYDEFKNPTKGMLIPYFTANRLPDPGFFNQNNLTAVRAQDLVEQYSYTYGEDEQTSSQILPDGSEIFFNYLNCQ